MLPMPLPLLSSPRLPRRHSVSSVSSLPGSESSNASGSHSKSWFSRKKKEKTKAQDSSSVASGDSSSNAQDGGGGDAAHVVDGILDTLGPRGRSLDQQLHRPHPLAQSSHPPRFRPSASTDAVPSLPRGSASTTSLTSAPATAPSTPTRAPHYRKARSSTWTQPPPPPPHRGANLHVLIPDTPSAQSAPRPTHDQSRRAADPSPASPRHRTPASAVADWARGVSMEGRSGDKRSRSPLPPRSPPPALPLRLELDADSPVSPTPRSFGGAMRRKEGSSDTEYERGGMTSPQARSRPGSRPKTPDGPG
ncbi:unnamed protein product, partial [Mycena citricolor]